MCTIVLLRRPDTAWPVLLAGNRDEMRDRPWRGPGRHWPDRPEVVAGQDELAGGSWLGVNDHGVLACILNRYGSLGPAAGKRSRGELVLEALDHADASAAAAALAQLEPSAYRSFNLVIADSQDAFWLRHIGEDAESVVVQPLPPGLSMITAADRNDTKSPRIGHFLPRFRDATPPDPAADDWSAWEALLASRDHGPSVGPEGAMNVALPNGFGTVSSSLLALAKPEAERPRALWRFAAGSPDGAAFETVDL
ncbi:NRDE family protein [Algihabitans albus]|uniref:NRDE family protein n=1 Tax=Algihabitans albus TaxID=2164067 RepID=UPI000E5CA2B7|nr:NRDE family protein [Algihabitans albus]